MKDPVMTRRDFVMASAALAALPSLAAADGTFIWAVLLHLGANMWDDFELSPDQYAKSLEEEKANPQPKGPTRTVEYHSYLHCDDSVFRKTCDVARREGCNLVFIDLGEGLAYPSHPELAVPGTWSVEKMRRELARLRAMGLEPIPKLNFSTTHDAWLKEYHRMVSTRKYYEVIADVIRDTCEIFDRPRFFHIGYDEEHASDQHNHFHVTARQGDLWWHDLNYTIGQVEKHGAQAVMWADACWFDSAKYVKRMSKGVLQQNWYYRSDFSEKALAWKTDFEKSRKGWPEVLQGAAAFLMLQKAGFRQLPCTSNWFEKDATEALVKFCKERMDPSLMLGICTAPWAMSIPTASILNKAHEKGEDHTIDGLVRLGAAKRKYYN